jgi:photosystem II stability/assembly factor-like uncharacterized protein
MHAWNAVASSADGTKLVASTAIDYKPVAGNEVTFDGNQPYIYTSTDAGATWKKQPGAPSMNHLSISADGMRVLGSGSATYLSLDGGVNWTKQNSDPSFVAVSGNGKKFVVAKFHTIATAETTK